MLHILEFIFVQFSHVEIEGECFVLSLQCQEVCAGADYLFI